MCPIPYALPARAFASSASIQVTGFNRTSTDHVSCTVTGTDIWGKILGTATASLTANQPNGQIGSASVNFAAASNLAVTCHLPGNPFGNQGPDGGSGTSWLTNIAMIITPGGG